MDQFTEYQRKSSGTCSESDFSDESATDSILVDNSRTENPSTSCKRKVRGLIKKITSSSSSDNDEIELISSHSENENKIIFSSSDSENENKIIFSSSDSENERDTFFLSSKKKPVTLNYSSDSSSSQEELQSKIPEEKVTTNQIFEKDQNSFQLLDSSHSSLLHQDVNLMCNSQETPVVKDQTNVENSLLFDDSSHSCSPHQTLNLECKNEDVIVSNRDTSVGNDKPLPFVDCSQKNVYSECNNEKFTDSQTSDCGKNIVSPILKINDSNSDSSQIIETEAEDQILSRDHLNASDIIDISSDDSLVLRENHDGYQIKKVDQNAAYRNKSENKLAKSSFIPASSVLKQLSNNVPNTFDIEENLQALSISASKIQSSTKVSTSNNVTDCYALRAEVEKLTREVVRIKTVLKTVNLSNLPDRGVRLQMSLSETEKKLKMKREQLMNIESTLVDVSETKMGSAGDQNILLPDSSKPSRLPYGMGKRALETQRVQKSLTVDSLKNLHGSLKSSPSEDVFADDPKGLKREVSLMPHQKHALAWMLWREKQTPAGGILADDMGLGKTLSMISLVLKYLEEPKNESSDEEEEEEKVEDSENTSENPMPKSWYSKDKKKVEKGGTLIVCPASLLSQWSGEVKRHSKHGVLNVEVHHGPSREKKDRRLARYDMVITTYSIVRVEAGIIAGKKKCGEIDNASKGVLHRIKWERVILDEAHVVRNHKSQQSVAVCQLRAKHRWALTGTPIHNKELDLYALLKFLQVSPFDDYYVWRRWVDNKNAAGLRRLNTVMNSLMLRRTKDVLQEKGTLTCLPERNCSLIDVTLDEEEFSVYKKVLIFSRTLFAQFLNQRAAKEGESLYMDNGVIVQGKELANAVHLNSEMSAMQKKIIAKPKVKAHEVLVLLLRLRQICCHPGLIKAMLDKDSREVDGIEDADGLDMDLLEKLSDMSLQEHVAGNKLDADKEVKEDVLTQSNPVFNYDRLSSKMRAVLSELTEKVTNTGDKAVIVSQWTSMLNIMADHLRDNSIICEMLTGSVPVKDRMQIVEKFNNPSSSSQVLLLSLTAGGVGLNLVGANHLFLLDLHWNPQLESQACDRIYRVGQKKAVHIYKFVCQDTVEQRIKILQDQKLALASGILTGARNTQTNKLSLDDLKLLFNM